MQGRNGYFRDENRLQRFRASKPTRSFHEKGGHSPAAPRLVSTPGAPPTRNPAGGGAGAQGRHGAGSAEPGSLAVQQRLRPTQRPRTAAQPDLTPRHFHVSPPSRLSGRDNREGRAPSAQGPSAHAQVPGAPVSRPRQRRGGRGLGPLRTACRSSNEGVGTDPQARPGRPAAGGALGLPRWVLFWEPRAGGGGEGASIAPKSPNGKGREAGAKRQDLKGGGFAGSRSSRCRRPRLGFPSGRVGRSRSGGAVCAAPFPRGGSSRTGTAFPRRPPARGPHLARGVRSATGGSAPTSERRGRTMEAAAPAVAMETRPPYGGPQGPRLAERVLRLRAGHLRARRPRSPRPGVGDAEGEAAGVPDTGRLCRRRRARRSRRTSAGWRERAAPGRPGPRGAPRPGRAGRFASQADRGVGSGQVPPWAASRPQRPVPGGCHRGSGRATPPPSVTRKPPSQKPQRLTRTCAAEALPSPRRVPRRERGPVRALASRGSRCRWAACRRRLQGCRAAVGGVVGGRVRAGEPATNWTPSTSRNPQAGWAP